MYIAGKAAITNTTIFSNSAQNGSGAYFAGGSGLTLVNVTMMSNTAPSGVITNELRNAGQDNYISLLNTIIGGTSGGSCAGSRVLSLGHNLVGGASCVITGTGDFTNSSAALAPFQDNGGFAFTMVPLASSKAVNGGANAGCPAADQRGIGRPIRAACDIGAVESSYLTPQTITFGPLADRSPASPAFAVSASASSALTVTFTAGGSCTASGVNGSTLTLSGAGIC